MNRTSEDARKHATSSLRRKKRPSTTAVIPTASLSSSAASLPSSSSSSITAATFMASSTPAAAFLPSTPYAESVASPGFNTDDSTSTPPSHNFMGPVFGIIGGLAVLAVMALMVAWRRRSNPEQPPVYYYTTKNQHNRRSWMSETSSSGRPSSMPPPPYEEKEKQQDNSWPKDHKEEVVQPPTPTRLSNAQYSPQLAYSPSCPQMHVLPSNTTTTTLSRLAMENAAERQPPVLPPVVPRPSCSLVRPYQAQLRTLPPADQNTSSYLLTITNSRSEEEAIDQEKPPSL